MKGAALLFFLIYPAFVCLAETELPTSQVQEPNLYDHYMALQQMQGALLQRSQEDQARLQPQMQRAEREACQRLREEREAQVSRDEYRRQGGDQFFAFVQQFEQYCQMLH